MPSLRPYRTRGDVSTWVRDETVVAFLEDRLARQRYAAIGERIVKPLRLSEAESDDLVAFLASLDNGGP